MLSCLVNIILLLDMALYLLVFRTACLGVMFGTVAVFYGMVGSGPEIFRPVTVYKFVSGCMTYRASLEVYKLEI